MSTRYSLFAILGVDPGTCVDLLYDAESSTYRLFVNRERACVDLTHEAFESFAAAVANVLQTRASEFKERAKKRWECSGSKDGLHHWETITTVGEVVERASCQYCAAERTWPFALEAQP